MLLPGDIVSIHWGTGGYGPAKVLERPEVARVHVLLLDDDGWPLGDYMAPLDRVVAAKGAASTATCEQCGTSFQMARSTAVYCGDACRKKAQRARAKANRRQSP